LNTIAEDEERDELIFRNHMAKLTRAVLAVDALDNQKEYLKDTPKPEKMSIKQWIKRIKNINSYLPLMEQEAWPFSKKRTYYQSYCEEYPFGLAYSIQTSKIAFENTH
jgi:hypothetical protein